MEDTDMKKFKNLYTLAALLMAGAAITACTSDDLADEALAPQQGKTYTLSVNATKGADTRALTENATDGSLTAAWNADDEVTVYKGETEVGTLKPTAAGATKLQGEVTGVAENDELTLKFQADADYTSQEGTLEYIDQHCSAAVATVTVTEIVGDAVTTSDATFENQQSITKFTFSETVSKVIISGGVQEITVTPTQATATLYVAMPATDESTDYIFSATVDGATYLGKKGVKLDNGKFYTAIIGLTSQTEYTDLSAEETANTYMVTGAGKYKFKATVKGNGGIDPLTGTTATTIDKSSIEGVKVLWELKEQGLAIKHDGTSYDIFYSDGYVYFSTPDELTSGDCYVAVYDSEDTILWSWLIWATVTPETTTYEELGIMDRNIGALNVNSDTYKAGFLYQWGRKDPFPAGTFFRQPTQYVFVPARTTALGYEEDNDGFTMAYSVAHPTTQLGPASACWLVESEFTVNLWLSSTGTKTIYDPCPAGWRIPTKDEISKVWSSGVTLPGGGSAAGNSRFEGYCNGGTPYYWTSTAESRTDAWCCQSGTLKTANGNYYPDWRLSSAMSIRPVKE